MAKGIRDKVAILGMGCSKFGERWESEPADLMSEAYEECLEDSGIDSSEIDAAWLSTAFDAVNVGPSAIPLSTALRLRYIPVTHVENMCASGTEAFRGACYAVASGTADFALALGVEKLKDTGYGGLPARGRGVTNDLTAPTVSAPGAFAQLAAGYRGAHRVDKNELKRAMAHVSVKSHDNGLGNPKAHLRKKITHDQAINAPMVAEPIGLFDCCGVSDGAACAIVTTPEIALSLGKTNIVTVKALQLSVSNGEESGFDSWNGAHIKTTRIAAKRAYSEAQIKDPRKEISATEVHDCFSITELVTMEDLDLANEGEAWKAVLDGRFDAEGQIPCQIDGGLKCFGHPIGASGLRMLYEMFLQFQGRAGERQINNMKYGLTHNLGGHPVQNVSSVAIIGHYDG
ncbi:MAG: acetyl-CoA acetyltransferase [Rhodospirillaceae bacterium]|nr:acetyl-CoA acetyltransferase [Rhodospirillaceae bacterium]|tara:strand:+ start:380 stop:1582 length:1203 start_codon:yes stop_codon:yes gene_type:complete